MTQNPNTCTKTLLIGIALFSLIKTGGNLWAGSEPPVRCAGYGDLQSISLTDWETGLGSWTVGTHDVADPSTFDTPDWDVVGSLPDSQPGIAAFVANLDIGDCGADDQTGALTLDSPPIAIPGGVQVARISIDHWFASEFGWDGGNFKISVNGSAFTLIPASAIEAGPYNSTLFPAVQDDLDYNTNPLADQGAFTGPDDGQPPSSWGQSRINLLGIAAEGDTIKLRFDFGVDGCGGDIGWYVDEVEFYSCEAELPPSDCGNSVIDPGEQCDDGNNFINDGCSNICQIDDGWQCAAPTPPGDIADPSFEDGTPNPSWTEVSNNSFGTPICEASVCGTSGGTGASDGLFWVWLGGTRQADHEGSVSQSLVIPSTVTDLTFDFEASICDSSSDYVEVLIDGNRVLRIDGSSPLCGIVGYFTQSADISAYADGGTHDLEFHSETFSNNGTFSNFFIDVIAMPGGPSVCTQGDTASLTLVKQVTNNNGGSAVPANWTLTATGPTGFSGSGPSVSSGADFEAGSYDLSESGGPAGYAASDWVCTGGTQNANSITLAQGEAATCTITNDDIELGDMIFKSGFESN